MKKAKKNGLCRMKIAFEPALAAALLLASAITFSACARNTAPDAGTSGSSGSSESESAEITAPESTGQETSGESLPPDTPDEPTAEYTEYYDKYGGVTYHVYKDHAVVADAEYSSGSSFLQTTVEGVPVTAIAEGALDDPGTGKLLTLSCFASSEVYEEVREYAESTGKIFIECGSGKLPDHFYPENAASSVWSERDRSGDDFVFEDDNERMTELAEAYLSGDTSAYDELLRRVMYRYACISRINSFGANNDLCVFYERSGEMCDDCDRYSYFGADEDGTHTVQYFRFAYSDIDTYDELTAYIHGFLTDDAADYFLADYIGVEGVPYRIGTGMGLHTYVKEPEYELEISPEKLTLHERRDVWNDDEDVFVGYEDIDLVLENHDGKWKATVDTVSNSMFYYPDIFRIYGTLYGAE